MICSNVTMLFKQCLSPSGSLTLRYLRDGKKVTGDWCAGDCGEYGCVWLQHILAASYRYSCIHRVSMQYRRM